MTGTCPSSFKHAQDSLISQSKQRTPNLQLVLPLHADFSPSQPNCHQNFPDRYSCLSLCSQCQAGLGHYRQCLAGRPTHSPPNMSPEMAGAPARPHRPSPTEWTCSHWLAPGRQPGTHKGDTRKPVLISAQEGKQHTPTVLGRGGKTA